MAEFVLNQKGADEAASLIEQGKVPLTRGQYTDAVKMFRQSLEKEPWDTTRALFLTALLNENYSGLVLESDAYERLPVRPIFDAALSDSSNAVRGCAMVSTREVATGESVVLEAPVAVVPMLKRSPSTGLFDGNEFSVCSYCFAPVGASRGAMCEALSAAVSEAPQTATTDVVLSAAEGLTGAFSEDPLRPDIVQTLLCHAPSGLLLPQWQPLNAANSCSGAVRCSGCSSEYCSPYCFAAHCIGGGHVIECAMLPTLAAAEAAVPGDVEFTVASAVLVNSVAAYLLGSESLPSDEPHSDEARLDLSVQRSAKVLAPYRHLSSAGDISGLSGAALSATSGGSAAIAEDKHFTPARSKGYAILGEALQGILIRVGRWDRGSGALLARTTFDRLLGVSAANCVEMRSSLPGRLVSVLLERAVQTDTPEDRHAKEVQLKGFISSEAGSRLESLVTKWTVPCTALTLLSSSANHSCAPNAKFSSTAAAVLLGASRQPSVQVPHFLPVHPLLRSVVSPIKDWYSSALTCRPLSLLLAVKPIKSGDVVNISYFHLEVDLPARIPTYEIEGKVQPLWRIPSSCATLRKCGMDLPPDCNALGLLQDPSQLSLRSASRAWRRMTLWQRWRFVCACSRCEVEGRMLMRSLDVLDLLTDSDEAIESLTAKVDANTEVSNVPLLPICAPIPPVPLSRPLQRDVLGEPVDPFVKLVAAVPDRIQSRSDMLALVLPPELIQLVDAGQYAATRGDTKTAVQCWSKAARCGSYEAFHLLGTFLCRDMQGEPLPTIKLGAMLLARSGSLRTESLNSPHSWVALADALSSEGGAICDSRLHMARASLHFCAAMQGDAQAAASFADELCDSGCVSDAFFWWCAAALRGVVAVVQAVAEAFVPYPSILMAFRTALMDRAPDQAICDALDKFIPVQSKP